jgi:O-acetylserine/cysteine efflux transporter
MPLRHLLLALAVVAIWGTNFVVIRWGLAELPPFAFATLRFALASLPLLPFVKRPAISWKLIASFGLLSAGQFGLLFLAMRSDISPGLASLVIQTQVFFTIGLALVLRGEGLGPLQILGFALAIAGMVFIGLHVSGGAGDAGVSVLGLLLVLGAALSWAVANQVARAAGKVDPLGFMVWSSLASVLPMALLSLLMEGGVQVVLAKVATASLVAWAAVIWQAVGNSLFGFGAWNWLLARHPAATVAPTALLVPVFGMVSSALLLGEVLPAWKIGAATLVLGGLALNLLAARLRR